MNSSAENNIIISEWLSHARECASCVVVGKAVGVGTFLLEHHVQSSVPIAALTNLGCRTAILGVIEVPSTLVQALYNLAISLALDLNLGRTYLVDVVLANDFIASVVAIARLSGFVSAGHRVDTDWKVESID